MAHFLPKNFAKNMIDLVDVAADFIGSARTDYINAATNPVSLEVMNANILCYNECIKNKGFTTIEGFDILYRSKEDGDFDIKRDTWAGGTMRRWDDIPGEDRVKLAIWDDNGDWSSADFFGGSNDEIKAITGDVAGNLYIGMPLPSKLLLII